MNQITLLNIIAGILICSIPVQLKAQCNVALGKSSKLAFDGNYGTSWNAGFGPPASIQVDLGSN